MKTIYYLKNAIKLSHKFWLVPTIFAILTLDLFLTGTYSNSIDKTERDAEEFSPLITQASPQNQEGLKNKWNWYFGLSFENNPVKEPLVTFGLPLHKKKNYLTTYCSPALKKKYFHRLQHAREILGKRYQNKHWEQSICSRSYNDMIRKIVRARLPVQFKKNAKSISNAVLKYAKKYHFDPAFILAVIDTESHFDPSQVGKAGELGLMQIMPTTGQWMSEKLKMNFQGDQDLRHNDKNIHIGVSYLAYLRDRFDKSARNYISAYNLGPARVRDLIQRDIKPKDYTSQVVLNYFKTYQQMKN